MNNEEMGRISLTLLENFWITTPFSPEGLTKIGDKLKEISVATGIPLAELRDYAAELMRRLIMRFAPAQTIRQILGDEEMGRLSLIFVMKYLMTDALSLGGLEKIGLELEKISAATGISLEELREYATELMKRLAIHLARHPDELICRILGNHKKA